MKLLKLWSSSRHLSIKVNLTQTLYRTLILISLFHQIRTLGSGSGESEEVIDTQPRYQYHRGHRGHGRVPSVTLGQESSLENSVKYSRNSNNAIVRVSHNRNSHPSQVPTSPPPPSSCLNCPSAQQNAQIVQDPSRDTMPEETLRKMRLELIKQQILKKLRLTEPPKPPPSRRPHYRNRHASTSSTSNANLPLPVILGETLPKHSSSYPSGDRDVEDFYGKTEQLIVFPDETERDCPTQTESHPSSCFRFKLPRNQIRWEEIGSVELWVFKLPDPQDHSAQSFYVNQLSSSSATGDEEKLLAVKSNIRVARGWFSFNLTTTATSWLRKGETEQSLQLGCSTCAKFAEGGESDAPDEDLDLGSPVGSEGEERPFLVFNMAGGQVKKRSRRHINCSPGVRECCRERFVVDFKEIGWDWIIGPQSYDAFFCKGSCVSVNGLSSSASRRASIIGKYLHTYGNNNATAELVPCCTATRMSSISLIYNDWGVNSTTPSTRTETLPNMVVESCGCL